MNEVETVDFVCPECGQEIEVTDAMERALLDHGCVLCGAAVAPDDFS